MVTQYRTRAGDVVDSICARYYGTAQALDAIVPVLEANPGLADQGAVLPAGIVITLPEIQAPAVTPRVKLWN